MLADVKLVQFLKALSPIDTIVLGILSITRFSKSAKALEPINRVPSFNEYVNNVLSIASIT